MLRAYGAEVVICLTAVEHDSPESYYSVSDRLAEEIPGAFKPDQYRNMANPDAHYRTTGPEIWEQTDQGDIDALVISVGDGRDGLRGRPLLQGARRANAHRRRRPGRIRLHGRGREGRPLVPRRGNRQGHVAPDDGPRRRGRVGSRLRPRLVRGRAALAREEGLLVGGSAGTTVAAALAIAGRFWPEATILTMIPRQRTLVPVEVPRRQLDAPVRVPRAFSPPPTVEAVLSAKRLETADVPL